MNHETKKQIVLRVLLCVVIVALLILCVLLVQQYQHIRHLDYVATQRSLWKSLRGSGPLSPSDASSTQTWMTLDYVGRAFKLPPDYLKTALSISDSRYPRLTIASYAKSGNLSPSVALLRVTQAIRAYFAATSSVPSSIVPQ